MAGNRPCWIGSGNIRSGMGAGKVDDAKRSHRKRPSLCWLGIVTTESESLHRLHAPVSVAAPFVPHSMIEVVIELLERLGPNETCEFDGTKKPRINNTSRYSLYSMN